MRAKKKLTKLWSILLVLVMLVGLLPTTALAEGATPAPATTTATTTADFTSGDGSAALALLNAAKTDGAADSVWKSDTKTLTLNGINFTTTAAIAVKLPHGSTIVLPDGTTNIIKSENSNNSTQSCGIYLEEDTSGTKGDLTIKIPDGSTGTGKLTVTGGAATEHSQGIRSGSGKVTISGGIVEATGGTAALVSEGILAQKGLAISGNAKVTAIGGSGSSNSYGIYGSSDTSKVEISDNADVTAISAAASNNSYGIYIYLAVNITGGTVKCSAGAASYSYGIYGNKAVNITGGTVKVSAGAASRSYGIFSINNVNIDSAEVTAAGKSDAIKIYDGSLTTSNVKNISFDANSGTGAMQAYTNNTKYTLPANGFTAPDGKVFKGWKVGEEIKAVGEKIDVSGPSTTVYAQWGDAEYTVNVTNGTASPSKAAADTTVKLTADPAPDGKVFDKWEVVSGGITLANANNATTTFTMPAGAVSVKATYHTHSYGSEWKTDANKHWHECACSAKSAEAAHTAGDWIIDTPATATTAGTKHKACTVCGYEMESSTIPATGYTVSFDANGGSVTPASAVTGADGKLTSLPTPTRSGYTFNGWYTATSGGTKVDTNYVFSADTTIYAQWTSTGGGSTTYTVSFDANGGSGTMADVTGVSGEYTLPANGFTAPAGKQFKGWATTSGGAVISGTTINVTANTTLYAIWEAIPVTTYTITFDANGGTCDTSTLTTDAEGKLTSLPTPTRSGYTFNGWYTATSGGTKVDTNYVFAADTTIYAQWTSTGGGSSGSSSGSSGSTITVPVSDPKNQVKVTASVSGSTATVQKIDLSKIDQAQGVTIDFTGLGRTIESAKLPTSAIKEIGATEGGTLTVKLTAGNVTFDTAALKAVADQAGSQITLTLAPVKTSALNASQKETVGDAPVFDLRLLGGSKAITNFKGGNVTVTLPHTLSKGQEPAGVVVYYLSNDGNPEACKTTYDAKNKLVTFTTTHFSLYFVGYEQPAAEWKNPFTDVAEGAWYFDSVKYVHSEGMMVGTGDTKFSPDTTTTRGMIVTILYRLEGEPAVSSTSSFNDVAEGKYYANAVKWAAENEIVGGYGNGQFGPEDPITREQMAAILYRYATFKGLNMTKTADLSKFTDNGKISDWSKAALNWANAERLISGKSGGVLDPLGTATRAEVAAMLMRYCELEK